MRLNRRRQQLRVQPRVLRGKNALQPKLGFAYCRNGKRENERLDVELLVSFFAALGDNDALARKKRGKRLLRIFGNAAVILERHLGP